MTGFLLDASVLISLSVVEHEHHDLTSRWAGTVEDLAVSPVVEGALVRFLVRIGERATTAQAVLRDLRATARCRWVADDVSYVDADLSEVRGHRQVTDSYLVALAIGFGLRVATLDRALAVMYPADCLLVSAPSRRER